MLNVTNEPRDAKGRWTDESNIVVHHGTSLSNAHAIKSGGLAAGMGGGMSAGSADQANPFVFVTTSKEGAEWYADNNLRNPIGAVVTGRFSGKLYHVKETTSDYGAMHALAKELGSRTYGPTDSTVDLADLASKMQEKGVQGTRFKDRSSNRVAMAVLPSATNFKK